MASAEPKLTEKGKEAMANRCLLRKEKGFGKPKLTEKRNSPLQLPQGGGMPSGWKANAKANAN